MQAQRSRECKQAQVSAALIRNFAEEQIMYSGNELSVESAVNEIHTMDRFGQGVDFSGITFGSASPTDIDMSFDIKSKDLFCFAELKLTGNEMPMGQSVHYHRLGKCLAEAGQTVLFVLAEHDTQDCSQNILARSSAVKSYKLYDKSINDFNSNFIVIEVGGKINLIDLINSFVDDKQQFILDTIKRNQSREI